MRELPPNLHLLPVDELDPIESYLDDEMSSLDRRRFELRVATDPELATELELARSVRTGLRSLPRMACPEPISQAALDYARRHPPWRERWHQAIATFLSPLPASPWRRLAPALSTLAVLTLAVVASIRWIDGPGPTRVEAMAPSRPARPVTAIGTTGSNPLGASPSSATSEPALGHVAPVTPDAAAGHVSPEELAQAERDVKLALAYLGRFGRTATVSVQQLATREDVP
jgi:anti-sigma factor RsiW